MAETRVVVDTNIFIDGIFHAEQFSRAILQLKKEKKISFVMNKEMQEELVRVFFEILFKTNEKLKKTKGKELNIYPLLASLSMCLWQVEEIDHNTKTTYCKDDHDDDKFVDCCIDGKVKSLITHDKSHLGAISDVLEKQHNIEVMSAFQFYARFKRDKS